MYSSKSIPLTQYFCLHLINQPVVSHIFIEKNTVVIFIYIVVSLEPMDFEKGLSTYEDTFYFKENSYNYL